MVRVFLKSGVWKNSEDEILKAAVQKYGKQMWSRVASLLNRKTAKQAKARWHEWLDPSIRKTEWSRPEEEKLLHLAKLMPAQWKTVAPLVGRTASQCQEHYEYLLDQAAAGDAAAGNSAAETTTDSLRQQQTLRPGQIDSHPETKPARPDPIDMDEDEMEMLQEARARLANTQGKKAKRKEREKMLAQAKRLADLQKRRELKQAGLLSKAAVKKSKRKSKEIDLGVEIPFHKPAPAGFHDTSTEDSKAESVRQKRLKSVDFQKLNENQYRTRDRDAANAKKREETRLRVLEQSNDKYATQKEEIDTQVRPRGTLTLPAPTVTDAELVQLAKIQQAQQDSNHASGSAGGATATQALLGDYSDRPLPTPMRTPQTSIQQTLMRDASHLRMLERGQTPLLVKAGGDTEYNDMDDGTTEMDVKVAAAATPGLPDRDGVGRTPGSMAPATRDQFGLNRPASSLRGADTNDASSVGASTFASSKYSIREVARQERKAAKRARQDLEAALAALPAPQFEYELAAPEDVDMEDNGMDVETVHEADRADLEAAERELLRKEAEKLYEARNSVVKRKDLPRPTKVSTGTMMEEGDAAKQLIQEEMITLLQHDAHAFPMAPSEDMDGKKKKKKRKQVELMEELPPEVPLDIIQEAALNAAKETIQTELDVIMNEKVASLLGDEKASSRDDAVLFLARENEQARKEGASDMLYKDGAWSQSKGSGANIDSLRLEFETLQEATEAMRKKNDKLESKLSVMNGGYSKRAEKFREDILQNFADLQNARIEESVYQTLQSHEVQGGINRIEGLKQDIAGLRGEEALLQKRYGDLVVEKRRKVVKSNSANAN
jgi:pre-mRNA-splicing factor CDC5/CEF1